MFRKVLSVSVAVLFVTSTVAIATPANAAAAKNGVSCKKAGLKATSGGKRYTCSKNPYVSPTKLTWTQNDCIEVYKGWRDIELNMIPEAKGMLPNLSGQDLIDQEKLIAEYQKNNDQLLKNMTTRLCKKGR